MFRPSSGELINTINNKESTNQLLFMVLNINIYDHIKSFIIVH